MPNMRNRSKRKIAIVIGDLHLQNKPPRCYNVSNDEWMHLMERHLSTVCAEAISLEVPLLIAGDIFDTPNVSWEVVQLAMEKFSCVESGVYSIPGQHDLPSHDIDSVSNSAYGVLRWAGVHFLRQSTAELVGPSPEKFMLHACPWDGKFSAERKSEYLNVGIAHKYIWKDDAKYTGAPDNDEVSKWSESNCKGFDIVFVGDNHEPFVHEEEGKPTIVNMGSMMIRTFKQLREGYHPRYYVLDSEGSFYPQRYAIEHLARFQEIPEDAEIDDSPNIDTLAFTEILKEASAKGVDIDSMVSTAICHAQFSRAAMLKIQEIIRHERQ